MAHSTLGIRTPEGIGPSVEEDYSEHTGMTFEVHYPLDREEGDQRVIIGAYHEDVGLVVWHDFDTFAEYWDWADISYD